MCGGYYEEELVMNNWNHLEATDAGSVVCITDTIGNSWVFTGVPGSDSMKAATEAFGKNKIERIIEGTHPEYTINYIPRKESTK